MRASEYLADQMKSGKLSAERREVGICGSIEARRGGGAEQAPHRQDKVKNAGGTPALPKRGIRRLANGSLSRRGILCGC
jgi:hypothetical protein